MLIPADYEASRLYSRWLSNLEGLEDDHPFARRTRSMKEKSFRAPLDGRDTFAKEELDVSFILSLLGLGRVRKCGLVNSN